MLISLRSRHVNFTVVMAQSFNDTEDIEMMKKNRIGPDEIIVQLEGNTMQAKVARTTNYCNLYDAFFQVPVGGLYFLKVIRLRQDYTAVKYVHEFPTMEYSVLLETPLCNPHRYNLSHFPHTCVSETLVVS